LDLRRAIFIGAASTEFGTGRRGWPARSPREPKGGTKKSGEYFRGLAKVDADERDRSANFATKVAGVKERMVRLAERQGAMPAAIVTTALAEVSLTAAAADALKASIARQVREVTR
jgi:hypothetical protein